MSDSAAGYWYSRWLFERSLALLYLVAFLCAANQFVPLLGERGLLPVRRFVTDVPFSASPSLFFFAPSDRAFRIAGWIGVLVSCVALSGILQRRSALAAAAMWATLWILYLSFVNVGQTFYGFGWESLLLETGLFAVLAGSGLAPPNFIFLLMLRWILFRLMFGAGMGARIDRYGSGAALQMMAWLGAMLAALYGGLWLYFRSRGGYKVVRLGGGH